jgi:hypothetical protein
MSTPTFKIRGFNPCESLLRHTPKQLRRFIRRMKDLQMNTLIVHYDYGWKRYKDIILEETAKAGVEITLMTFGPRSFYSYTDWKPEWFAKRENSTPFTSSLECETQPCRFEQEGVEAFSYGAREWLKELPSEIIRVHMRAADGLDFCQCEKCRTLPDHEKWQPFVDIFVNAVLDVRPDLDFETDVYVKRYNLSADQTAHQKMPRIMYDTFYRLPHVPLGIESWNKEAVYYAATESAPDAGSPTEYHANRLKEWCKATPGKIYIHENAMAQSLQGVFQHNTGVMLKDLELYRELGVQGVCYEAYEPGYINFEKNFELLAKAMLNLDDFKDYKPSKLEAELTTNQKMRRFCDDMSFPLKQYIDDPFELEHVKHCRRCMLEISPQAYRDYVNFVFQHEDILDALFIPFNIAKLAIDKGELDFSNASEEAQDMLSYRKLWDFMEEISMNKDPRVETKRLIINLAKNVR